MRIAVTGGAGFIGCNLVRRLVTEPSTTGVTVVDDLSTGSRANLEEVDGVRLEAGSILDDDVLDRAIGGADAVVHLAAVPSVARSLDDPFRTHEANATGTLKVLEAARRAGTAHVIVASSSSVYGANEAIPKREDLVPMPVSPYAVSKLAAQSYALAWSRSFGLDVLALRFFNVYGPFQTAGHAYAAVVPAFVSAALTGEPLMMHGDGTQSRDFTFVGSLCDVITDALARRVTAPGPVNLAFGTRITLLELVGILEEIIERPLAVQHVERRRGDVDHSQADQEKLRALFPGLDPVDIRAGLRATVAWYARELA